MLYVGNLEKRYFDITLKDGTELNVEAPSLKNVKELEEIVKHPQDKTVGDLVTTLSNMLSQNAQGQPITASYLYDTLQYDEITAILTLYMRWVKTGEQLPD